MANDTFDKLDGYPGPDWESFTCQWVVAAVQKYYQVNDQGSFRNQLVFLFQTNGNISEETRQRAVQVLQQEIIINEIKQLHKDIIEVISTQNVNNDDDDDDDEDQDQDQNNQQ